MINSLATFFLASAGALGTITFLVGAAIVVRKSVLSWQRKIAGKHAARYREIIAALVLDDDAFSEAGNDANSWWLRNRAGGERLLHELTRPWSVSCRAGLLAVLTEMSRSVRGESLDRVTVLFEQYGFVQQAMNGLKSRRWWVRARSCRDLGAMRSRRALYPLVTSLQDPAEDVRQEASLALVDIMGVGEALGIILQNVAEINHWFALRLSVAVGTAAGEALEHLVHALDLPSDSVRRFAAIVLGEVQDPTTVPALLGALETADVETRAEIHVTLGKIGDERALPALMAGVDHPEERIRRAALLALGVLGAPAAAPVLSDVIRSAKVEDRRTAAASLMMLGASARDAARALLTGDDILARESILEALDDTGAPMLANHEPAEVTA